MKGLLLALALLSATIAGAQQFSVGARTGIGLWRGSAYDSEMGLPNGNTLQSLWEKEIFFRLEPVGRFAYEAGFMHFAAEGSKFLGCPVGGAETYLESGTIRHRYYGLNLRAQYNLSGPQMKKLSHFAGVALTPQLHVAATTDRFSNMSTEESYIVQSNIYEASFGFAIEDMLRYRLSNHFDLHSLIACRGNVNSTLLVHGFTMQLGAAYRF